jgi:hypothetical protein
MRDSSPIEAVVPQPMRTIGIIFILCLIGSFLGYFYRIFIYPDPPDEEIFLAAWVSFIGVPIVTIFALPLFLKRYPSWVVFLLGSKYLHKFIADCRKKLGKNRSEKAHVLLPHAWFEDKLVFWITAIVVCFVLGFAHGMEWL